MVRHGDILEKHLIHLAFQRIFIIGLNRFQVLVDLKMHRCYAMI